MNKQTQVDGVVGSEVGGSRSVGQETASSPVFCLIRYIDAQRKWSSHTFGPSSRVEGICKHIEKELAEVRADPTDVYEWVDVAILALDGAWRAGFTSEQIVNALAEKQMKNFLRTYPRTADDMPSEHIREPAALSAPSSETKPSERVEVTEGLSYELPVDNGSHQSENVQEVKE
jgi:hypothetical protein